MLQVPLWRRIAVLAAIVLSLLLAAPNVLPASVKAQLPSWLPRDGVKLGLDLRGGSYLLLSVEAQAVMKDRLLATLDDYASQLTKAEPRIFTSGRGIQGEVARLQLRDPAQLQAALKIADGLAQPVPLSLGKKALVVSSTPEGVIELSLSPEARKAIVTQAVSESIEVIRRRVNELGTADISLAKQGADRIVVQAPGQGDPEDLKRQIGKTAKLTFHLLDETADPALAVQGRAPPGSIIVPYREGAARGEPFLVLKERPLLSGDDLTRATATFDQVQGVPAVSFQFNPRAARRFGQVTTSNVGKRFAIVLDDQIITAPNIREPILGGSGQISGGFSDPKEAEELAALLRAGALPAPLTFIEQRTVGPGLGQDSIDAGIRAGLLGVAGVLVIMALFYGLFGLFSIVALAVNMLMVVAGLSLFGASLTLPGIAGLILTLGMAVDANVLIYERMREEARAGKGPALSIDAGFARALVAIADSNLTTILAALVLGFLGQGPVRGFAVTLIMGIVTSVFTAIFVTQILVSGWFRAVRPKQLPI